MADTPITNESEAMEVWRQAFTRHNTTAALTVNGAEKADQAAARVIATALEARDAENSMLAAGACIYPNGDGLFGDDHGNSYCGVERARLALDEEVTNLTATVAERDARIAELEGALRNPPKHRYWGAGEPDCPREIKCSNGELHTMRCKVCGEDSPRNPICLAALGETANAS